MAEINYNVIKALKSEKMTEAVRKMVPVDKLATTEIFTGRQGTWQSVIKWNEITFPQTLLPFSGKAAPAWNVDLLPRVTRYEEPAHVFIRKALDRDTLTRLHTLNSEDANGAVEIVRDELTDMKMRMDYTVEYLCWQALTGSISVDQTSSYAADVSKIKVEATYPITKTTITDGYRLDTAADTFFTEGMQEMRDADYGGFGDLLGHCYGNGKVFNGLYNNTQLKAYMSDRKKDEFWARGENQVPIADFIFQQFDRGYVSSGTYTKFIADHYVIRVPISPQWRRQYLYLHELSAKVPGPNRDGLIDISPGIYAYADVETNPPAYVLYMGYYFLPVIKWPAGVDYTKVFV